MWLSSVLGTSSVIGATPVNQVVEHSVVGTSSVVGATPVNQVVEHCVFSTNGVQATPLALV